MNISQALVYVTAKPTLNYVMEAHKGHGMKSHHHGIDIWMMTVPFLFGT